MKCDYGEQISMLIDGELSGAESEKIRHHLATCKDCRTLEKDFLFLRGELKKPLREKILDRATAVSPTFEKQKSFSRFIPRPALALALFMLICAVAGIIFFISGLNKDKQVASEAENRAMPELNRLNKDSLARFDKGGRAEIYVASKNENQ